MFHRSSIPVLSWWYCDLWKIRAGIVPSVPWRQHARLKRILALRCSAHRCQRAHAAHVDSNGFHGAYGTSGAGWNRRNTFKIPHRCSRECIFLYLLIIYLILWYFVYLVQAATVFTLQMGRDIEQVEKANWSLLKEVAKVVWSPKSFPIEQVCIPVIACTTDSDWKGSDKDQQLGWTPWTQNSVLGAKYWHEHTYTHHRTWATWGHMGFQAIRREHLKPICFRSKAYLTGSNAV